MSENVSDAELEANSLQLFTTKGRWSSALWEWKGGEHPSPLFSLRGQSCLFGHTPAVILVWITAVCVCMFEYEMGCGLVMGLQVSQSVRRTPRVQARWRKKKSRGGGGQLRQTMRFCDAFIPPYKWHPRPHPRKHGVPKMCEKKSSWFVYFFCISFAALNKFLHVLTENRIRDEISNRKPEETS